MASDSFLVAEGANFVGVDRQAVKVIIKLRAQIEAIDFGLFIFMMLVLFLLFHPQKFCWFISKS
jgi:hypothetical protein